MRRHGLTVGPDVDSVQRWFRIILNRPDAKLRVDDVLSFAEILALSLARAEVQLRCTHLALAAFEAQDDLLLRELSELETKQILYAKIMAYAETPKLFWQAIKLIARVDKRRNRHQDFSQTQWLWLHGDRTWEVHYDCWSCFQPYWRKWPFILD